MEDTYWPPYFHRNTMSEFVGVIVNGQDREEVGDGEVKFWPFGGTLNSAMVPHGMDRKTHEDARKRDLKPEKLGMGGSMIFLFESEAVMGVSGWALEAAEGKQKERGSLSSLMERKSKL